MENKKEIKKTKTNKIMANRRLVSNRIVNSAKFLQMPAESQLLYFHMLVRADDDGILETYPLLKMLGLPPDNYKVLIAKGLIRELNAEQVIVITDWLEHNTIRADRKVDSIYLPLLREKYPELPVIDPKPRSDVKDNSRRLLVDSPRTAEVKLSKDKLREDNSSSSKKPFYRNQEMRKTQGRWWVLPPDGGEWLEYNDSEKEIEWRNFGS